MENQAPYAVTLIAEQPAACPLAAALTATAARLQAAAAAVGLPDFSLNPSLLLTTKYTGFGFSIHAKPAGVCWAVSPISLHANSMEEAETKLTNALAEYAANALAQAADDDPAHRGRAEAQMYRNLVAA